MIHTIDVDELSDDEEDAYQFFIAALEKVLLLMKEDARYSEVPGDIMQWCHGRIQYYSQCWGEMKKEDDEVENDMNKLIMETRQA